MYKLPYYKSQNYHIRKYKEEIAEQDIVNDIQREKNAVIRAFQLAKITRAQALNEIAEIQRNLKKNQANPFIGVDLNKKIAEDKKIETALVNPSVISLREYLTNMSDFEFNKIVNTLFTVYSSRNAEKIVNKLMEDRTYDFQNAEKADDVFEIVSNIEPTEKTIEGELIIEDLLKTKNRLTAVSRLKETLKKNNMNENIALSDEFKKAGMIGRINKYLNQLKKEGKTILNFSEI